MTEKPDQSKPSNTYSGFLRRWSQRKSKNRVVKNSGDENPIENCDKDLHSMRNKVIAADEFLDGEADGQQGVADALGSFALRQLFRNPEFSASDGLNEYDDDFSNFVPLGDLVPQEMKTKLDALSNQILEHDRMIEDYSGGIVDDGSIANSECCGRFDVKKDTESGGKF